jgi:hypothetical protein
LLAVVVVAAALVVHLSLVTLLVAEEVARLVTLMRLFQSHPVKLSLSLLVVLVALERLEMVFILAVQMVGLEVQQP